TTTTLTLQNVGNTAETVSLAASGAGVIVTGLNPLTLAVGQTATETITLTPDPASVVNSTLTPTITATYGPTSAPLTVTTQVNLLVRSVETVAIDQAAVAAGQGTNTQLPATLTELGDAVSQLQATPANFPLLGRVRYLLGNLSTLLSGDPGLASFVT